VEATLLLGWTLIGSSFLTNLNFFWLGGNWFKGLGLPGAIGPYWFNNWAIGL